jgi:inosine-uridine nucleoside N-ribohydrolase
MNLIVETDIGRDPDDLFAIAYLIAAGVSLRAVLISPGDRDQVAVARLLLDRAGVSCPVGVGKPGRDKSSSGGLHYRLLDRAGRPRDADPDGDGPDVFASTLAEYPDCELFVIGPLTSVGRYLRQHPDAAFARATMQGGFLGYHQHAFDCPKLPEFDGYDSMPTFNLNGDRKGADAFLTAKVADRRMVGKNVCHTIWLDAALAAALKPRCAASEFFAEAARLLLENADGKKFHDPTAAVCHLHPEIGQWVRGRTVRRGGGWGTELAEDGDHVLAAIDHDALWSHLGEFR